MTPVTRNSSPLAKCIAYGGMLSLALLGATPALAQQAPTGLEKAATAAAKWAVQADANQAADMWKASSSLMQKSVNQADWAKYIATLRQELGAEQSRSWAGVTKVVNPQGLPAGEYLNVIYTTKYAKAETIETVSLAKDSSNWQPVGYIVRPAQPAPAANSAAPTAPSAPAGK